MRQKFGTDVPPSRNKSYTVAIYKAGLIARQVLVYTRDNKMRR